MDISGGSGSHRLQQHKASGGNQDPERSRLRLQDAELQQMADGGWSLSMHQPWASLLVKGIKRYSNSPPKDSYSFTISLETFEENMCSVPVK